MTAVHGDRGGGVTGRVARVHGKVFEPDHVRTVPGDQERRRPVGGRLDRERADQERGEAPLPEERGDQPERGDEDRQHDSARDDRPDQRRFREIARPVVRQNADEAAVVACDRPVRDQHPGDEETEQDRETGDGCVGKDDADEERARRMRPPGKSCQSSGRCIPAVENGRGRTVVAGSTARSRLLRFNSLRITVLVAIRSGPPGSCRRLVSPDRPAAKPSVCPHGQRRGGSAPRAPAVQIACCSARWNRSRSSRIVGMSIRAGTIGSQKLNSR